MKDGGSAKGGRVNVAHMTGNSKRQAMYYQLEKGIESSITRTLLLTL